MATAIKETRIENRGVRVRANREGEDEMEVVNLKSAVTFRVDLAGRVAAFSTKTFRGKRGGTGTIPEPKEHVIFDVAEIAIDATDPWYRFDKPARISVIWSNVLSVQLEEAIIP